VELVLGCFARCSIPPPVTDSSKCFAMNLPSTGRQISYPDLLQESLLEVNSRSIIREKARAYKLCCLPSALAAAISCPAEVTLVRISNDAQLAPEKRRNYKGVVDAFQRILREEGVKTFFSGCGPFVNRAMMVGAVQVGTYDQFREMYKDMGVKHELLNVFYASMTSGLIYAIATMPFETAKNRMAFQVRYSSITNCSYDYRYATSYSGSIETRPRDEGASLPQRHADHNDDRQDRRRAHSLERLPAVLHSLRRPHGADVHVRGVAEKAVPEDAGGIKGLPIRVHVVCLQQC
jgi:hypothetical protein